jgi:diguanylate cyclase (GGDEF)-like protein/PAS domain S-box-containing protein
MRTMRIPSENPLRRPEHWERALDTVPAAVLLVDRHGSIVYANEEAGRLTGYTRAELTGLDVETLVPEPHRAAHAEWRSRWRAQRRPMGRGLDISCRRADGSTFPADVSLAPVAFEGATYVVATLRDETERRRNEEDLLRRALHDPLTGLPNRVLFLDRLTQALGRAGRQDQQVAVLYVDLDGFKNVNDTWGHGVGDAVLQAVGQRLAAALRPGDSVARFGGDEFLVLCEGLSSGDEAVEVARRLLEAVSRPLPHRAGTVAVSASVGIAMAGQPPRTAADLLDAADRAMYQAKKAGSSRLAVAPAPPRQSG